MKRPITTRLTTTRLIASTAALLAFTAAAPCRLALAQAPTRGAKPGALSKYQQAKDLIKQARALLREFTNEQPPGDDAYFAGLQLKTLDRLNVTDIPIMPVTLTPGVTWRIITVDPQDAYTKITIEFHNMSETRDARFSWFDQYPLAIIAGGKFYAMKKEGLKVPDGTAHPPSNYSACQMQGGQTARAVVYFDPLDAGMTAGQVKYQFGNEATPAEFSLLNLNQRPGATP